MFVPDSVPSRLNPKPTLNPMDPLLTHTLSHLESRETNNTLTCLEVVLNRVRDTVKFPTADPFPYLLSHSTPRVQRFYCLLSRHVFQLTVYDGPLSDLRPDDPVKPPRCLSDLETQRVIETRDPCPGAPLIVPNTPFSSRYTEFP